MGTSRGSKASPWGHRGGHPGPLLGGTNGDLRHLHGGIVETSGFSLGTPKRTSLGTPTGTPQASPWGHPWRSDAPPWGDPRRHPMPWDTPRLHLEDTHRDPTRPLPSPQSTSLGTPTGTPQVCPWGHQLEPDAPRRGRPNGPPGGHPRGPPETPPRGHPWGHRRPLLGDAAGFPPPRCARGVGGGAATQPCTGPAAALCSARRPTRSPTSWRGSPGACSAWPRRWGSRTPAPSPAT